MEPVVLPRAYNYLTARQKHMNMKINFLAKWPFLFVLMITVTVCSINVTGNSNRSYVAEQSEPLAYQNQKQKCLL